MPDTGEYKRPAGKDPSSWGVEEVVWFIKDADPQALGPHAEAFRKHVSSGSFVLQIMAIDWSSGINVAFPLQENLLNSSQHYWLLLSGGPFFTAHSTP